MFHLQVCVSTAPRGPGVCCGRPPHRCSGNETSWGGSRRTSQLHTVSLRTLEHPGGELRRCPSTPPEHHPSTLGLEPRSLSTVASRLSCCCPSAKVFIFIFIFKLKSSPSVYHICRQLEIYNQNEIVIEKDLHKLTINL